MCPIAGVPISVRQLNASADELKAVIDFAQECFVHVLAITRGTGNVELEFVDSGVNPINLLLVGHVAGAALVEPRCNIG